MSSRVSPPSSAYLLLRLLLFPALLASTLFAAEPPPTAHAAPPSSPAAAPVARAQILQPREDSEVVLSNPDMGWVVYENYPLDRDPQGSSTLLTLPADPFPGVAAAALMFSWADIEQQPDEYDFSAVDHAYDYWSTRGKSIQLRLSTESLLWWSGRKPPTGMGVPQYVLERLPEEQRQRRQDAGEPAYHCVDARAPYYQERLGKFLSEVARRYPPPGKGGTRPVTLVDLRGFGKWGEWHSGFRYPSTMARRDALTSVLDTYARSFPAHWLSLSYSYDPDGPREYYAGPTDRFDLASTGSYAEFLRYSAFDHALTLPQVTFRRDGAGGAVHSNERQLCETAFRSRTRGPFMCEFLGGFAAAKQGRAGWIDWMIEDALSLHPNYINLLGWQGKDARDFLRERPDLVARGARTMGYRLIPREVAVTLPSAPGGPLQLATRWVNRGVGRALRDYHAQWSLHDSQERCVSRSQPSMLPTSQWIQGTEYAVADSGALPPPPPGRYRLALTLIDPLDQRPIQLPLAERLTTGIPVVGLLTIP